MKVAVASDHAGFVVKQSVCDHLRQLGHDVTDLGPNSADRVDYPDFARSVALAVQSGSADRGVLVCGSGIGMAISANRFSGVRAVVAVAGIQARLSREHNDANVLCIGARFSGPAVIEELVDVFMSTRFEGGRHAARLKKIDSA